ncbi:MAG: ABC transporter ATP-binding protein [Clostridia bacterium]|nr:ABC transporter ATP-binding protein [Clostridia bacterium]
MLQTENIDMHFGDKAVLKQVNLQVEGGHIFGLLGTNGAGKSTLLRIISGIIRPVGGRIRVNGAEVWENPEAKRQICYLTDDPAFLHASSIAQMGSFRKAWQPDYDLDRLAELCERFSLPMHEKIGSFSKGTQKRVQVCLALAGRPHVMLCDETFDGLDPVMREAFRRTISEETWDRGMVTILAGHNQQEMEDICDSVGFLHEGNLLTVGDMDTVVSGIYRIQFATEEPVPDESLVSLEPLRVQRQGRLCVLTVKGNREKTLEAVKAFQPIFSEILPLSLEEVFILEMEEQGYAQ